MSSMIFTNVGIQIFRNQSTMSVLFLWFQKYIMVLRLFFFPNKITVNLRGVIYPHALPVYCMLITSELLETGTICFRWRQFTISVLHIYCMQLFKWKQNYVRFNLMTIYVWNKMFFLTWTVSHHLSLTTIL